MNRFSLKVYLFLSGILLSISPMTFGESQALSFERFVIDDSFPGAYQVAIEDINNDGKLDIAALGEGSGVYWYENPTWKKRPISGEEISHPIDFAFHDLDHDGDLECALAYEFSMSETLSGGKIAWLDRNEDLDQHWHSHLIYAEPTAHRLRWARLKEGEEKRLFVLPIMGVASSAPDFHQNPVLFLSFTVPENPSQNPWQMDIIDHSLHIAHGLNVVSTQSQDILLTASVEGIKLFAYEKSKDQLIDILFPAPVPQNNQRTGSSEVAYIKFKKEEPAEGVFYLSTIEPWHGNQVVVYTFNSPDNPAQYDRQVIDDSFINGHALATADFNQDGVDEIIAGYRGKGHTIYLYELTDRDTMQWKRQKIDDTVATQGFATGDINQDGKVDFVASGGSTHNVVLYINQ